MTDSGPAPDEHRGPTPSPPPSLSAERTASRGAYGSGDGATPYTFGRMKRSRKLGQPVRPLGTRGTFGRMGTFGKPRECGWCGATLSGRRDKLWCSDRCRMRAKRAERAAEAEQTPTPIRRTRVVRRLR